ncbi:MAG: DUF5063 domain-containing protein [Muribaculaceae bacterium]|nr:DUF5063 domain-containing protein [Muribaculaceae bacterium]
MTPNTLTFIALCNEYCQTVEAAPNSEQREFVNSMLGLLPRIYITARALESDGALDEGFIDQALDEDSYNSIAEGLQVVMGEDDTFLEVFEEDMKYSDTPVAAAVSELLADLYQVCFNFIATVREAPEDVVASAVAATKEEFEMYWAQTLCNVLRPLNAIYYRQ